MPGPKSPDKYVHRTFKPPEGLAVRVFMKFTVAAFLIDILSNYLPLYTNPLFS